MKNRKILILIPVLICTMSIVVFARDFDTTNVFETYMGNDTFVKGMSTSADNLIINVFRWLGWWIIAILTWLLNHLSHIMVDITTLNPLTLFGIENTYMNKFVPLALAILGIVTVIYAYKYMSSSDETLQNIIQKIIMIVFVIVFLIPISTTLLNLVFLPLSSDAMSSLDEGLGTQIVLGNVVDMQETLINDDGTVVYMSDSLETSTNDIKESFIMHGDVGTKGMEQDELPDEYKDKKLENVNGNWYSRDLESGWFEWDEQVYRYSYNFFAMVIMELAVIIAVLFGSIIFARVFIFELPTAIFLAAPIAAASTRLDKMKKVLSELLNMVLGLLVLLYSMYIYIAWSTLIASSGISLLTQIIIYIAGAIFVIGGSQFFTRVTGYDPGVKDGLQAMYAANTAMQGASALGHSVGKVGEKALKAPQNIKSGFDTAKEAGSKINDSVGNLGGNKFKEGLDTGFMTTKAGAYTGAAKNTLDSAKEGASEFKNKVGEKLNENAYNAGEKIGSGNIFGTGKDSLDTGVTQESGLNSEGSENIDPTSNTNLDSEDNVTATNSTSLDSSNGTEENRESKTDLNNNEEINNGSITDLNSNEQINNGSTTDLNSNEQINNETKTDLNGSNEFDGTSNLNQGKNEGLVEENATGLNNGEAEPAKQDDSKLSSENTNGIDNNEQSMFVNQSRTFEQTNDNKESAFEKSINDISEGRGTATKVTSTEGNNKVFNATSVKNEKQIKENKSQPPFESPLK